MKLWSIVRMVFSALAKPTQRIVIQDAPTGRVLDIGGGGEGVIAQAGGARVVAIDKLVSEIDEARDKAPDIPWVLADAAELPFADRCFDHATSFFSCMYMSDEVKEGAFRETRRVLKTGGEFRIWDARMARKNRVFAIRLKVTLPGTHMIQTVYGVEAKDQSAASICGQLQEAGFESEVVTKRKHWFLVKARS